MSALFPVVTLQMGERQTKCRFVRGGRRDWSWRPAVISHDPSLHIGWDRASVRFTERNLHHEIAD